jgi:hypothetical protein
MWQKILLSFLMGLLVNLEGTTEVEAFVSIALEEKLDDLELDEP